MTDRAELALLERARLHPYADLVVVDGFHAVKHALRFGADLLYVLAADADQVGQLAATLAPDIGDELEARMVEIPRNQLAPVAGRLHPTGLIAVARRPDSSTHPTYAVNPLHCAARLSPAVLVDDPRHHGNVGALIRVAAAAAASGVVILRTTTASVDPWSRGVVRGAAGLHWAVPVVTIDSVDEIEGPLWTAEPSPTRSPDAEDLPHDGVLCLGSERSGVSQALRARSSGHVCVPMAPGVSSLNLAVAAGILLFRGRTVRSA